ncbi:MAG: N-acetylmuramoyl-L-alanine amidase [Candidatus Aminicenantes bacterium]|nr:N-acetylmuramoyl-L-alanine amidase [Candidatus Aminicenantes bacterium]
MVWPLLSTLFIEAAGLFVKDYRKHLNPAFKKGKRSSTRFIIVHTSEAGLKSTLRTLSKGKRIGKSYRTKGGHAHYTIARNGQIYRLLSHKYRADHAGLSMWDGVEDISSHSLGIELVGFHYDEITAAQYRSLSWLLKELQRIYHVPDINILTHCQVSYGEKNRWFKRSHRGRKRCALNFDRLKAGLRERWLYDPDVGAGRLTADRQIAKIFYNYKKEPAAARATPQVKVTAAPPAAAKVAAAVSNIIAAGNTAWNIAGEDYDNPTTIYILPGRDPIRGDRVEKAVGWDHLPTGTEVLVNQPLDREEQKGPIFLLNKDYSAWSFAGAAYRQPSTIYFLPSGKIRSGSRIRDWDSLPPGTKLIIGYRGPVLLRARKGKTAWGIAGKAYDSKETVYFLPGKKLLTGDQVKDFSNLPRGTKIFVKAGGD